MIYFFWRTTDESLVKIGFTKHAHPTARIAEAKTWTPEEVMYRVIPGDRRLDATLKEQWRKYRVRRADGILSEWYQYHPTLRSWLAEQEQRIARRIGDKLFQRLDAVIVNSRGDLFQRKIIYDAFVTATEELLSGNRDDLVCALLSLHHEWLQLGVLAAENKRAFMAEANRSLFISVRAACERHQRPVPTYHGSKRVIMLHDPCPECSREANPGHASWRGRRGSILDGER